MSSHKRIFLNLVLGVITCFFIVSQASFSMSRTIDAPLPNQSKSVDSSVSSQINTNLQEAETMLLAQAGTSSSSLTRYVAVLSGSNVVPNPTSSPAFGAVGAALVGNRLVVRGDFSNLTSALRDYQTDPLSPPNPNITSAVHLHRGDPTANGPFQYALQVQPGANQRSGRLQGEYTLTEEQLQALTAGTMYVDLHTTQNRAGELRGILRPI